MECKTKIWVNHYGWIMGGNPEKGFRFTKQKDGAKPFSGDKLDTRSELFAVCKFIELEMLCNYDLVLC